MLGLLTVVILYGWFASIILNNEIVAGTRCHRGSLLWLISGCQQPLKTSVTSHRPDITCSWWKRPLASFELFIEARAFWNDIKNCTYHNWMERNKTKWKWNGCTYAHKNCQEPIRRPGIPEIMKSGSFKTSQSILFSFTFTYFEEPFPGKFNRRSLDTFTWVIHKTIHVDAK